jgi:DNA (cytosine-5)-methyltransferase 1
MSVLQWNWSRSAYASAGRSGSTVVSGAYYNDSEPYVCQWLSNLIAAGHIAPGDVDERSIADVHPDDLRGYTQCHFFAGIGGWSLALRLAGWPDDRPVWTGSCPCQPFSAAGAQRGSDDERHLWPAFFRLIRERRPTTVFGEQVAGAAGLAWLDHVCADLESEGYAAAAADMPACCIGAPHVRQRLWWMATANDWGQRIQGGVPEQIRWEPAFSWCKDVRRIEDLRGRSDLPEPLILSINDGISNGVGRLRAYGNAIVPQVAAEFIRAFCEST